MTSFFLTITIISLIGVLPLLKFKELKRFPEENLLIGSILLLIVVILYIGLRNPNGSWLYFGDTYRYTLKYQKIQANPNWTSNKDLGFYYYMKAMSKLFNIQTFYLITASLYVLPVCYSFYKWFNKYSFFAIVLFVTSMSFWPFGINGMRNGLATSFFILALAFREKKIIMYSIVALSISFHTSMVLPALCLFITEFYNNTKLLLKFWLSSIAISFLFGESLMNQLNSLVTSSIGQLDGRGDFSGVDAKSFSTSFYRIDFVIYSAIVVGLAYYFLFKIKFNDLVFKRIFNIYLISNTIWLYFIYFPYTNRIAYLSWFLIPLLVVYPIIYSSNLKNNSYFMFSSIGVSLIFVWLLAYL